METGFVKNGKHYHLVKKEEPEVVIDNDNCEIDYEEWKFSLTELNDTIQSLNDSITGLMVQSEYYGLDSYERITNILDAFMEEWQGLLQKGKDLQFVEATDLCDTLSEDELYMLDKAVFSIGKYISVISANINDVVID